MEEVRKHQREKDMSGVGAGWGGVTTTHTHAPYTVAPLPHCLHIHTGGKQQELEALQTHSQHGCSPLRGAAESHAGGPAPPTEEHPPSQNAALSPHHKEPSSHEPISHLCAAAASCVATQRCRSGRTRSSSSLGGSRGARRSRHFHLLLPSAGL